MNGLYYVVSGSVSGDTITFESPEEFDADFAYFSTTYDESAEKSLFAYRVNGGSNNGVARTLTTGSISTNLTSENFIGVSTDDYADGAEATVQIAGVNADQQGMTVGKQYILPDGSLTTDASSSGDYEFGTPEVFLNGGTAAYISTIYDPVNNKVVIAYRDDVNNNYGTAVVGTVSGSSITFGTPVVFQNGGRCDEISAVYDLAAERVVICYKANYDAGKGMVAVGAVSGDSITFGASSVFESLQVDFISAVYDSSSGKVVASYKDVASKAGTAVVGTVSPSNNSILFGTKAVFNSQQTEQIRSTYDPTSNRVVTAYIDFGNGSQATAVVGTVSGDSISFGTPVVFIDHDVRNASIACMPTANKVIYAYRDIPNSDFGTTVLGTVSGDSITFGTPTVFNSSSTRDTSATFSAATNEAVISWQDYANGSKGLLARGVVSGDGIIFSESFLFETLPTSALSSAYDAVSERVVIAYRASSTPNYNSALTYGSSEGEPNVFAGTAISSNELNIKDLV